MISVGCRVVLRLVKNPGTHIHPKRTLINLTFDDDDVLHGLHHIQGAGFDQSTAISRGANAWTASSPR